MIRLLLALLLVLAAPARAAFEDLGAGARAPGMGGAFVPVADDVYTMHYNPAGLSLLERPQLGVTYAQIQPGLQDGSNLSQTFIGYAHPMRNARKSTWGVAYQSFSMSGLYKDDILRLGYGRMVRDSPRRGEMYAGISMNYLRSSFGSFPEAANAVPTGSVVRGSTPDPVLSGSKSFGALDADIGFLHRMGRHYSWGASITHVMQPNVAFNKGDKDKLPMGLKLGLGYRSLISNIVAQLDSSQAPNGGRDNLMTVGAERIFTKLFVGEFAVRGGLSFGAREQKNLAMGMSYKTKRMGADYAMGIPIGGLGGIFGAHRIGLTFRFGGATEEEETVEALLEAMKQMKSGVFVEKKKDQDLKPADRVALDETLAVARSLESKAQYAAALEKFGTALTVAPADKDLVSRFGRLSFVGRQIKQLPDYRTDSAQAALHLGLIAYVSGDDRGAIEKVSYALSLKPEWKELDLFLQQLELATGVKRPAKIEDDKKPDRNVLLNLTRANSAVEDGQYQEAIDLSLAVLRVDSTNAAAWLNLGTAYFALRDYENSLRAWNRAYELERTPAVRAAIRSYIRSIDKARKRGSAATGPVGLPEGRQLPKRILNPAQEQALLNQAVDAFSKRDFGQAKRLLEEVLSSNPNNEEAAKALRRVNDEMR